MCSFTTGDFTMCNLLLSFSFLDLFFLFVFLSLFLLNSLMCVSCEPPPTPPPSRAAEPRAEGRTKEDALLLWNRTLNVWPVSELELKIQYHHKYNPNDTIKSCDFHKSQILVLCLEYLNVPGASRCGTHINTVIFAKSHSAEFQSKPQSYSL